MRARTVLLLAALVVASPSLPAEAATRKPLHGSYDVLIPVPYPMESPGAHCTEGYDDLTRSATKMTLPSPGELEVDVSGFVGDWVLEIFDAKGRVLATGANFDLVVGERSAKYRKKRAAAETVTIVVCNFGGTPHGTVGWTYVFSR